MTDEIIKIDFKDMQKLCMYNWQNRNTLLECRTPYCQHDSKRGERNIRKRECRYENCPYRNR